MVSVKIIYSQDQPNENTDPSETRGKSRYQFLGWLSNMYNNLRCSSESGKKNPERFKLSWKINSGASGMALTGCKSLHV